MRADRLAALLVLTACAGSESETEPPDPCADDACVERICEPGELRCEGAALQSCGAGGERYVTVESCEHGCEGGRCLSCDDVGCEAPCEDDARRCNGDELQRCDDGAWLLLERCDLACTLQGCTICEAAEARCSEGGDVERCSEDELSYEAATSCELGCAAGACRVCSDGDIGCDDDTRTRCGDLGDALVAVEVCERGCLDGRCIGDACTPEETRCEEGQLQVCAADRSSFEAGDSCAYGCAGDRCAEPACDLGDARCDGSQPERCRADRLGYESAGEPCDLGCDAGLCVDPLCDDGDLACDGATRTTCAESRRAYDPVEVCPFDCEAGACVAPRLNLCILQPTLACNEASYALGGVSLGDRIDLELQLANLGDAPLTISALRIEGSTAIAPFELPALPLVLAPDAIERATWYVAPETAGPFEAELVVTSDDPGGPHRAITLDGLADGGPFLRIGTDVDGVFTRLRPGDRLEYEPGLQGLGHVFISLLAGGTTRNVDVEIELRHAGVRWGGNSASRLTLAERGDGAFELIGRRVVITALSDFALIEGATITLEATVTGEDGTSAHSITEAVLDVLDYPPE